jgi:hypothetical protein
LPGGANDPGGDIAQAITWNISTKIELKANTPVGFFCLTEWAIKNSSILYLKLPT